MCSSRQTFMQTRWFLTAVVIVLALLFLPSAVLASQTEDMIVLDGGKSANEAVVIEPGKVYGQIYTYSQRFSRGKSSADWYCITVNETGAWRINVSFEKDELQQYKTMLHDETALDKPYNYMAKSEYTQFASFDKLLISGEKYYISINHENIKSSGTNYGGLYKITVCSPSIHTSLASDQTVTREPTCTQPGEVSQTCTACGTSVVTGTLPAKGHTAGEETLVQPAGCVTAGYALTRCTVCGEEVSRREIPATGHQPGEATIVRAADCIHSGESVVRCKICGEELSRTTVPAVGIHILGSTTVIRPATCDTDGINALVCAICQQTYDEQTVPATGHSPAPWVTLQEATCTTDGLQSQSCSVCDEILGMKVIPARGHSFGKWTVVKLPSADEDGIQSRVCSICGEEETKTFKLVQP